MCCLKNERLFKVTLEVKVVGVCGDDSE